MTYRAASNLVGLAISVLLVRCVPIAVHSHDIGKHSPRTVVLVRIEEDAQALKLVHRTEDWAGCCALLGEPHCEAIAVEIALAVYLEVNQDLVA